MKLRSLAARIVIVVVGLDLLLIALLITLGVVVARTELLAAFDESLRSKALSIRALVRYDEESPAQLIFDTSGLPPSADADHPDTFMVYLANGELFARSPGWAGLPTNTRYSQNDFARFRENDVPFRALVLKNVEILDREEDSAATPARITVIYAASLLEVRSRVLRVGIYSGAAGILILLPMSWLTVWAVRKSLNPLHDLVTRAGQISVRQWSFDAPEAAHVTPELAPLTAALETLLHRLHDSFARQRQFTGDLAHELKTSVAIIKSGAQVLLQNPRSAEEYRTGVEGLLGDCDRLESLVERILRLARTEQWAEEGKREKLEATDLVATCEAAISRVAALAAAKPVDIKLESKSPIQLRVDPDDLELIWLNLLDNAVRHSESGSQVTMKVETPHVNRVSVCVEDAGEGIAPADLPHIFERFRRGETSRTRYSGGFGLGLAICKAIVEAYGGQIALASIPGKGTTVRVEFSVEENVFGNLGTVANET
jgi:signal transduction histidine kinase